MKYKPGNAAIVLNNRDYQTVNGRTLQFPDIVYIKEVEDDKVTAYSMDNPRVSTFFRFNQIAPWTFDQDLKDIIDG